MNSTLRRLGVVGASATLLLAVWTPPSVAAPEPAAVNDPVTVRLTVTGPDGTAFDGEVTTTGHTVTAPTGGTHICDGTNNGANPAPGATPTAALDDAAEENDFTWDGQWYDQYEDFLVTTIDGTSQTADTYWNIAVNGTPTPVGGCQFLVDEGDEVAFTWTDM